MKKYPSIIELAALAGVFICWQNLVAIVLYMLTPLTGMSMGALTFTTNVVTFISVGWLAVWYGRVRGQAAPRIGMKFRPQWWPSLLWAFALMCACTVVLEPLLLLFPQRWFDFMDSQYVLGWWFAASSILLAPVAEEMLFRGLVQKASVDAYGPAKGILLAAAVFGLVHWMPMSVINAFVLGIILGYVYYKTASIVPVVLLHLANNALAYFSLYVCRRDGISTHSLRVAMDSEPFYWMLYGVCCVAVVAGAVMVWRGLNGKKHPLRPFEQ